MLSFRNTNIIFGLLLIIIISIDVFYGISFLPYLLFAVIYLLILFYGSYHIGSQFYLKSTCKAPTTKKQIALTFDDGPAIYTDAILNIFEQYQLKATFFCIGKNIEQDAARLQQIHSAGHIIGNHSYSHNISFDFWSTIKVCEDLQKTHQLVKDITGKEMRWFRPPFGVTNPNIAKAVRQMNYQTIGWNIRSLDTVAKDVNVLFESVSKQIRPGAIILFHDICLITVEVLPLLIEFIKQQGYEIAPLDKLLNVRPYVN